MAKKTKCITVSDEQDQRIREIQVRRTTTEKRTVSYSEVIHQAIAEGLNHIQ
jgi:hypothetical protein